MSRRQIEAAMESARYIRFKYRKPGEADCPVRYAWPRRIKGDVLMAEEYTPDDFYEGKTKSFKLAQIEDVKVMPEGWSPDFEWGPKKHVDGDVVVEDVTTLEDRRRGCAAKAVVRKRRTGLMKWLFGE